MTEEQDIEDLPIGDIAYGDLEIPGEYMIREDGEVCHVKLLKENFLTVKVRKFLMNDKYGRKYIEYFKEKTEKIYVIEEVIPEEQQTTDEEK